MNDTINSNFLNNLLTSSFKVILFVFALGSASSVMLAQTPNLQTPMITDNLPNVAVTTGGSSFTSTTAEGNVINTSLTDFATLNIPVALLGTNRWIQVTDHAVTAAGGYPAGSYAGIVVEDGSLLGLGLTYTVSTYLGGSFQESRDASVLLNTGLLSGQNQIGFITTMPFDAIRFHITAVAGLSINFNVYYTIVQTFEAGPPLTCNAYTPWSNSNYPVAINQARTGVTGTLTLAALQNTENVISPSNSDFATITSGVLTLFSTFSISLQSQIGDITGGQLVGFELENTALLGVDLLGNMRLTTYLNNGPVETESGDALLAGVDLLSGLGADRFKVSMLTTLPFDEVQLTFEIPVGVDLGTTRIYNAFIKEFCEGDPLACNTMTSLDESAYPLYFNSSVYNLACVNCKVDDLGYVVDGNPNTAATVNILAAVGSSIAMSYATPLTPFPANTFVGFDIEANPLLSVDVLNFIEISLYNNGAEVFDANDAGLLAGVSTLLLTGAGSNRSVIGIVSPVAFDEVRLKFNNTVGANLGLIRVYDLVVQNGCATELVCGDSKALTEPEFPTVINFERTGTFGGVCAACQVDNPWNVISDDLTDVARLEVTAGVLQFASLSVLDPVNTFYPGTFAGFVIKQNALNLDVNLLNGLRISTYNNGVPQESVTAGSIIDLNVLNILVINPPGDNAFVLGFKVTRPFDEVRIELGGVLNVIEVLEVYYAFIDNTEAIFTGGSELSMCFKTNPDFNVTSINKPVTGNVSTNDIILVGTPASYGNAVAYGDNPAGGTLTLNPDGSGAYSFIATTPGVYKYSIEVCRNGQTQNCVRENLTITVTNPEINSNPPIANPDLAEIIGSGSVAVNVKSNDTGGNPGSALSNPTPGNQPPSNGTVNFNSDAVYTPTQGFYGVDSFSYSICDEDQPLLCAEALVIITIYPLEMQNTTSASDDFIFTFEGNEVTGNVLDNDFDPEGHMQSVVPIDNNSAAGQLVITSDGQLNYMPAEDFSGPTNYTITVQDNGTPVATVTSTLYILVEKSSPLPANLLSFNATRHSETALISWVTSQENNVMRFEIEHSTDRNNWQLIGTVLTNANADNGKYALTHQHPDRGVNYYRLRTVDFNASFELSDIKSVLFGGKTTITVSPNPTNGPLKIYNSNNTDIIRVFNATGRVVWQTVSNAQNKHLDLSAFPDGIYRVTVESLSGDVQTESVIKVNGK